MSALIKSSSASVAVPVRPFKASAIAGLTEEVRPSAESLLEARVAELEAERLELAQELERALELAREEGAREALKQRSEAEGQAMEALQETLAAALASWEKRLRSWDGAAAGIARTVLEQLFADASDKAALIEAAIARRIAELERTSIVRVRVSAADFADPAALLAAAERVGRGVELATGEGLKSGECLVDLKLGHVELSLTSLWSRVDGLLDRLERESAAS